MNAGILGIVLAGLLFFCGACGDSGRVAKCERTWKTVCRADCGNTPAASSSAGADATLAACLKGCTEGFGACLHGYNDGYVKRAK